VQDGDLRRQALLSAVETTDFTGDEAGAAVQDFIKSSTGTGQL
jgi:hypothetical protein